MGFEYKDEEKEIRDELEGLEMPKKLKKLKKMKEEVEEEEELEEDDDVEDEEDDEEVEEEEVKKPRRGKVEEPKHTIQVVKELPNQQVREVTDKDGTVVHFMTLEEALTKVMNSRKN